MMVVMLTYPYICIFQGNLQTELHTSSVIHVLYSLVHDIIIDSCTFISGNTTHVQASSCPPPNIYLLLRNVSQVLHKPSDTE